LSGTHETVLYLKQLGKSEFQYIDKYGRWVLEKNPEEGMEILIDEDQRTEDELLSHNLVVRYLDDLVVQNKISKWLVIDYLEYIIYSRQDTTPDFHNRLAALYIERVVLFMVEGKDIVVIYAKLIDYLRESLYSEAHKIVSIHAIKDNKLFEVLACLYNKMGKHEAALDEYVHNIGDFEQALRYCHENYNPDIEGRNQVYFFLVKVLLNPINSDEIINENAAITILEKFYKKMDVIEVLQVLPPTIKIESLSFFFSKVIRDTNARKRKCQIQYNLLQSEHMRIRGNLLDIKRGVVHINEQKTCGVCKKRLGLSDFYCYPNRVTVHMGCFKGLDLSICPVTGVRFGI